MSPQQVGPLRSTVDLSQMRRGKRTIRIQRCIGKRDLFAILLMKSIHVKRIYNEINLINNAVSVEICETQNQNVALEKYYFILD